MPKEHGANKVLENMEVTLTDVGFLWDGWLDARSILSFSQTCHAARRISSKPSITQLLTAVVRGDEDLARAIVTYNPELLLNSSAIVIDISGKQIKNLTPLQAAICAGDLDMVNMIKQVLQQKLESGLTLGFEPEVEIKCQFNTIYHNDDIYVVEVAQKLQALEFKVNMLTAVFDAINAAPVEQVKFELKTPGQNDVGTQLNSALHDFRKQFTAISNQDLIFNPFYLLAAYEFYDENFDNHEDSIQQIMKRRRLFCRQVIGYIQRHLPACYLQIFAQGISNTIENRKELKRDFEFTHSKGYYMRAINGDLINLGYKYLGSGSGDGIIDYCTASNYRFLLQTKKSGLERLRAEQRQQPRLTP